MGEEKAREWIKWLSEMRKAMSYRPPTDNLVVESLKDVVWDLINFYDDYCKKMFPEEYRKWFNG